MLVIAAARVELFEAVCGGGREAHREVAFVERERGGKEKGRDERDILFTCVRFVAVHAPVSKRMHEDVDAFVGAYPTGRKTCSFTGRI